MWHAIIPFLMALQVLATVGQVAERAENYNLKKAGVRLRKEQGEKVLMGSESGDVTI